MHCIPVLDLLKGQVVRAFRGERAAYRPLVSCLTKSSVPVDVAAALRDQFGSRRFYLADLDAILGSGNNRGVVEQLVTGFPDCEWWLDAGFTTADALACWRTTPTLRCVLGSESLRSLKHYAELLGPHSNLLSLDRRGESLMGPPALWTRADLWPNTVIAMNLATVGAGLGPDFAYLESLRMLSPQVQLVAAGGTRHLGDLVELEARGISAVLIASALHDGALTRADLAQIDLGTRARIE